MTRYVSVSVSCVGGRDTKQGHWGRAPGVPLTRPQRAMRTAVLRGFSVHCLSGSSRTVEDADWKADGFTYAEYNDPQTREPVSAESTSVDEPRPLHGT